MTSKNPWWLDAGLSALVFTLSYIVTFAILRWIIHLHYEPSVVAARDRGKHARGVLPPRTEGVPMRDTGYGKGDEKLMAEIERDGFGTLAHGPQGRTPVLYLGDAVCWVSEHPTAPPITLHGEVTRLGADDVQVYCEELDVLLDLPYAEVRRG